MENNVLIDASPFNFIFLIEIFDSFVVYYPEDNYMHTFKDKERALKHAKRMSTEKRIPLYVNTSEEKGIMTFDVSVLTEFENTEKAISAQPNKTRRLSTNG